MGRFDVVVRDASVVEGHGAPGEHFTLDCSTVFDHAPAWRELHNMRNGHRLVAVRDASFRARLIQEAERARGTIDPDTLLVVDQSGDGEGKGVVRRSLGEEARARGICPAAAYIELVLETDGRMILIRDPG